MYRRILLSLALLLASTGAQAHTGVDAPSGFAHGFLHPIGGIDHVLVMVAVGLFAVHLAGRALWHVPLSFLSMMTAGGLLGMAGVELQFVEVGIALSIIVLGGCLAIGLRLPVAAAMVLAGVFAGFHGYAHGAEMPETASGLAYASGFVIATASLHACGLGLGLLLGELREIRGTLISRVAGGAMAVAGVAILAGTI